MSEQSRSNNITTIPKYAEGSTEPQWKVGKLESVPVQIRGKGAPILQNFEKLHEKSDFQWTPEAKKEFQAMKQCITELPMVAILKPKEKLIIYLCTAREAINRCPPDQASPSSSAKREVNRRNIDPHGRKRGRTLMDDTAARYLTDGTLRPRLRKHALLKSSPDKYVVREIHKGSYSMHSGPRSVVAKAIRSGYYWLTLPKDARNIIQKCKDCQFKDSPFKDRCEKLNVKQRFASVKHPQTNEQVKRANHSLSGGIKARLDGDNKKWVEELSHVLWAHRTKIKSSNGHTPFSLTYGTEAVNPVEIGMPSLRCEKVDQVMNDEAMLLNLDILEEMREKAVIQEARSKAKMEKYYNGKVHIIIFKPEDFVYRSNEARHAKEGGKLSPKWKAHTR
nr:reverse transcriptase domain-containing protein [Tanacetum cinerariifolium]